MSDTDKLTRQQAADYLCVPVETFDKLLNSRFHPIPHEQVGKYVLISRDALDTWVAEYMDQSRWQGA